MESIVEAHNADRRIVMKYLDRIGHRPVERILRSKKINLARQKYGLDVVLDWIKLAKESK